MAIGVRMTLASFSARVESCGAVEAPDCAETDGAPAGAYTPLQGNGRRGRDSALPTRSGVTSCKRRQGGGGDGGGGGSGCDGARWQTSASASLVGGASAGGAAARGAAAGGALVSGSSAGRSASWSAGGSSA